MPREVLEETETYQMEWDAELESVVFTWTSFASSETFKDGVEALLDAIKQQNTNTVIVDTSGIQAHDDEDKKWIQEDWTPRAVEAGLEYSAQVHSDSVVSKMDMEDLEEGRADQPLEVLNTGDMSEARDWIASQA